MLSGYGRPPYRFFLLHQAGLPIPLRTESVRASQFRRNCDTLSAL
jgi:hypothetical protein